jgi:uncharacterized protein
MRARDGCRLDATVWRPEGSARYPVLLMRQPYGRAIASTVVYAHPAWYAAHGYVVAVQDVRGTGSSEGEFHLFAHEEQDGAEAVAWAASLDGSDGAVGMYGFSYQANTQYLALAGATPVQSSALRALAPAMGGWDIRTDWAFENGTFRLGPNLGWGLQMGFIKATHDGDRHAAHALRAAAQALPLQEANRTRPDVVRRFGHWTHYESWLTHPSAGPFWDAIAPSARLAGHALNIPMLHIGGWYDQMLMGTLAAHDAISQAGHVDRALHVGPWTHQPWGRRVGAVDFGRDAVSDIDAVQIAWFDRHLKGRNDATAGRTTGLTLFDIGAHTWRRFSEWPALEPWTLFLGGDGRAASSCPGLLRAKAGAAGTDRIVHDPWRPAPVMGGHGSAPAGMQDRSAVDDRADVAVYDSAPLERPVLLCGRVSASLLLESDQPSFDIDAVLSMLAPDGRAWTLTQGHARIDPGAHGETTSRLTLPMRAVCVTIPAGHAVRLSLAGAAAPSYAVNPGTGVPAAEFMAADERVITIAIRHGGAAASCLVLPEVI